MKNTIRADIKLKNRTLPQSKRMPVWMLVITDILLTIICLGIFALYHHVLPRHLSSEELVVATTTIDQSFKLPDNDDSATEISEVQGNDVDSDNNSGVSHEVSDKQKDDSTQSLNKITNYGNSETLEIKGNSSECNYIKNSEKKVAQVNNYKSDKLEFTTNKVEIGSGVNKITYYLSDIYVANVKYIKSAFAKGEYGKNLRESTLQMAKDNHALLAINGDFYGNSEVGIVIRNGVLYRTDAYDADICVLFTDGTMRTYSPNEFNADEVIAQGAWQAWIFGPKLLDEKGNVLTTFNSTVYLSQEHPRTAIGYVAPGHYVFVVVDGRNVGYSRGVTLSELGQIMIDTGCVTAYNLDGGKSSEMAYDGVYVNQPFEGGRDISDIIYLGE